MKFLASIVLLFFGLVWCGFLLIADIAVLPKFAKQIRASDFPTTIGQVTRSEITTQPHRKGYRPVISYSYSVGDREYSSDQTGFDGARFGDGSRQARSLTSLFPIGKEVTVFYNPTAPAEATLKPGLLPDHLVVALFMVPFHAIAMGLMALALAPIIQKLGATRRGSPLRPIDDLRMFVRMPWLPPWAVGMSSSCQRAALAGYRLAGLLNAGMK